MRLLYRYGIFFSIVLGIFLCWRYGLYIWLDTAIMQERAMLCQLQQQTAQQLMMERQRDEIKEQIALLKNRCAHLANCSIADGGEQCSYIFNAVQKSGLALLGYHTEKEKKKNNSKQNHSILLSLQGTLDTIITFLTLLKESAHLIQCTFLSLRQAEEKTYFAEMRIQFIPYKI